MVLAFVSPQADQTIVVPVDDLLVTAVYIPVGDDNNPFAFGQVIVERVDHVAYDHLRRLPFPAFNLDHLFHVLWICPAPPRRFPPAAYLGIIIQR